MSTAPDRIRDVVLELLEIDESDLTETVPFKELGVDSMTLIEIQAQLEQEFDIVIDIRELSRMADLRGVREVVARATAGAAGTAVSAGNVVNAG